MKPWTITEDFYNQDELLSELIAIRIERHFDTCGKISWPKLSGMILVRDNFTCHYCGKSEKNMVVDHKQPWSKGGTDSPENLVCACYRCNASKQAMSYEDFIGGLAKRH